MGAALKGDRLPSQHNVGIHCSPSAFLKFDANGQVEGVGPAAFRADNDGVSVNWLEHTNNGPQVQFSTLCTYLRAARTVRNSHRVGMMAVSDIESIQGVGGADLYAEHDPLEQPIHNPAHSLIKGVSVTDDDVLLELSGIVQIREFLKVTEEK